MAKPIGKTPVFEGKDAIAVLKKMQQPPTEKDREFAKKLGIKELFYFNFLVPLLYLLTSFTNIFRLFHVLY